MDKLDNMIYRIACSCDFRSNSERKFQRFRVTGV